MLKLSLQFLVFASELSVLCSHFYCRSFNFLYLLLSEYCTLCIVSIHLVWLYKVLCVILQLEEEYLTNLIKPMTHTACMYMCQMKIINYCKRAHRWFIKTQLKRCFNQINTQKWIFFYKGNCIQKECSLLMINFMDAS